MKSYIHATKLVTIAFTMMAISLPVMAAGGKGMTWGFRGYSFPSPPSPTEINGNRYKPSGTSGMHLLTLYVGCNALQHNWPYGYAGPWSDGLGNVPANTPPS